MDMALNRGTAIILEPGRRGYNPPVKQVRLAPTAAAAPGAPAVAARQPARPFDLLIANARIIDGTGGPSAAGSVGKVLGPGFIAPHSHSDFTLLTDGNAESKIRQGVRIAQPPPIRFNIRPAFPPSSSTDASCWTRVATTGARPGIVIDGTGISGSR
jgi:hypothetical protein